MTPDERLAVTADARESLQVQRDNKQQGERQTAFSAFHDARKVIERMQHDVSTPLPSLRTRLNLCTASRT